jgi:hypothetical protein
MVSRTTDDATTWRDLIDQLTPEQAEKLTQFEQRWVMPDDEKVHTLLAGAREWAPRPTGGGNVGLSVR